MGQGLAWAGALSAILAVTVHCGGKAASDAARAGAAGEAAAGHGTGGAASAAGASVGGSEASVGGTEPSPGRPPSAGSPAVAGANSGGATSIGCDRDLNRSETLTEVSFGASSGEMTHGGPAVVVASSESELVFSFALAASPAEQRLTIRRLDPMPKFPIGATVWLDAAPAYTYQGHPQGFPRPAYALSIRAGEGGTLLFGVSSSRRPYMTTQSQPAVPLTVSATSPVCSAEVWLPSCGKGQLSATYLSVVVVGDSPVTIADSERKTALIEGTEYEVSVRAVDIGLDSSCQGTDFKPEQAARIGIDVRAKNLTALIAALPLQP